MGMGISLDSTQAGYAYAVTNNWKIVIPMPTNARLTAGLPTGWQKLWGETGYLNRNCVQPPAVPATQPQYIDATVRGFVVDNLTDLGPRNGTATFQFYESELYDLTKIFEGIKNNLYDPATRALKVPQNEARWGADWSLFQLNGQNKEVLQYSYRFVSLNTFTAPASAPSAGLAQVQLGIRYLDWGKKDFKVT